jgi:3-hydroxyacyl-CoA dehydrogenase
VGVCLGGGCEILLHCDAIQAHTETTMGLVETRVGIVPGWGGCKELLLRAFQEPPAGGPLPPVRKVFELIAQATTSSSADHARELGFLRAHDRVTRNRDRLLADAKAFALELVDDYVPPEPRTLNLPGPAGYTTLALELEQGVLQGAFREDDSRIAGQLARVLSGGSADVLDPITDDDLLALERASNQALLATPETLGRIEQMLGGKR